MKSCLLLGSNLGDRLDLLARAQAFVVRHCGRLIKASKIYETEPWGFKADTLFLNQALLIETDLTPQELLTHCLHIEALLGRERPADRSETYCSRYIDIDILFYENLVCQTPELILPHPRLPLRTFALEPLVEVAPEWIHPTLGVTAAVLFYSLTNTGGAK